ncbi:baseplate protein [Morganella phage Mecenats66]|nr:baseplate protein [Morganella phage Mecenats66]
MAIVLNQGRIAIATAISALPIYVGIGSGDVSWDTTPEPEDVNAKTLVSPLGYRKATQVQFCKPKSDGEILVPSGNFEVSLEPTNYLYLSFQFNFTDVPEETIREVGVFLNTTLTGSQTGFITPEQIASVGDMTVLEHVKIARSANVRQQFEFIIQF